MPLPVLVLPTTATPALAPQPQHFGVETATTATVSAAAQPQHCGSGCWQCGDFSQMRAHFGLGQLEGLYKIITHTRTTYQASGVVRHCVHRRTRQGRTPPTEVPTNATTTNAQSKLTGGSASRTRGSRTQPRTSAPGWRTPCGRWGHGTRFRTWGSGPSRSASPGSAPRTRGGCT